MRFKFIIVFLVVLLSASLICCDTSNKPAGGLNVNAVNVDIYAFNDLHGNLLDSQTSSGGIGISKTTTYLKQVRGYNKNTVVLSSGDMWQGSSESNNTKGKILTDWMNLNQFSAMTVGNHEFDWGIDAIKENAQLANFPILGINVYEESTNMRAEPFEASTLVEFEKVTVGIIGAIGDCYSSISASQVEGYYFVVGDQLTELIKQESESLKSQGADIIVYSLHDGMARNSGSSIPTYYRSDLEAFYDVSLSDGYVDIVFEAHTHRKYVYKDEYGVYHVQASANNLAIAHADIDYDTKTGDVVVNKVETFDTDTLMLTQDSETDLLFEKYADEIGEVYETIGYNHKRRGSDELEDLVAALYLQKGLEKWGDTYDIFLGGGYLKTRSPYNLAVGDVCYKDLQTLFPFDNRIVLCSVSGYHLSTKFVYTDNSDYHNAFSDYGNANRTNIDENATYYIIVDTYTSDYAPNNLTVIAYLDEGAQANVYARDLLKEYIASGKFA